MINFETYHEVRRLSRELNLTPAQIASGKTSLHWNSDFSASAL
jgi:hypothetical protein